MAQIRHTASNPPSNSQTEVTPTSSQYNHSPGLLRLRGEEDSRSPANEDDEHPPPRHIRWSEDVIDNEGMGKKKSKVCCIYHKSHPFGESSSESESSDSDDSSQADSDTEPDKPENSTDSRHVSIRNSEQVNERLNRRGQERRASGCPEPQRGNTKRTKSSPNAYEKIPTTTKKHS